MLQDGELLTFLREGTERAHKRLEERPLLKGMRSHHADLHDWLRGYQAIAEGYKRTVLSIQASAFVPSIFHRTKIRDVAAAYERDVELLHKDGIAAHVGAHAAPLLKTHSQAIGAVWCLYGSRHGARVLLATAQKTFGEQALRYLSALHQQKSSMSNIQKSDFEEKQMAINLNDALRGALATFEYFTKVTDEIWEDQNER